MTQYQQKNEAIGQTNVNSTLGVNDQSKNKFTQEFDGKFNSQQGAAGNNAESKTKSGMVKGQNVASNSDTGLNTANNMSNSGKKVTTPDHHDADRANGLPDATNYVNKGVSNAQDRAAENVNQNGVHQGSSGYATTNPNDKKS